MCRDLQIVDGLGSQESLFTTIGVLSLFVLIYCREVPD